MTLEEKKEKLREQLDNIYCHNCKWHGSYEEDVCQYCHRKSMHWQPSEELLDRIIEIVMEKE